MTGTTRRTTLAFVIALVSGFPVQAATASSACRRVSVKGLGAACPVEDGFFQIEADAGTGLLVHGNDALSTEPDAAPSAASRPPVCVPDGGYRMVVVYARPADAEDRYAERLGAIRDLVADANGLLNFEATTRGATADYRVACTPSGAVEVRNEVLPTSSALDSFNSVVSDLRAAGYSSVVDKVWVWYEGSVGAGIAGTGHLYWDETRSVSNRNNAGPGSSSTFAVLWGQAAGYSVRTWMHENAHNLGAVQQNAPDSTGAAHCTDGQDVMCYADGGAPYNPDVCTDRTHFDCGHDSYFDPDPESGSYLATNWNLGWRQNRFIDLKPTIAPRSGTVSGNEGAGGISLTLVRDGVVDLDAPVTWTVGGGTADGADLPNPTGSVTIPSGQREATISIPVTDDADLEPGETAIVEFDSPGAGAAIPPVTVTIVDNDGEPQGSFGPMPDLAIGSQPGTEMRGEDILRPDGVGQKLGRRIADGTTRSFYVRVGNDGDVTTTFGLRIDAGARATVIVRDAATEVALARVTSDGRVDLVLDPGTSKLLRLDVRIARNTPEGLRRAFQATFFPHGDGYDERDVAFGNARVVA